VELTRELKEGDGSIHTPAECVPRMNCANT